MLRERERERENCVITSVLLRCTYISTVAFPLQKRWDGALWLRVARLALEICRPRIASLAWKKVSMTATHACVIEVCKVQKALLLIEQRNIRRGLPLIEPLIWSPTVIPSGDLVEYLSLRKQTLNEKRRVKAEVKKREAAARKAFTDESNRSIDACNMACLEAYVRALCHELR